MADTIRVIDAAAAGTGSDVAASVPGACTSRLTLSHPHRRPPPRTPPPYAQFTSSGQNVAAGVLGSSAAFTPGDFSVVAGTAWVGGGASQSASYATDLFADPMRAWTLNPPAGAIAGTATPGAFTWAVTFPSGIPQPISSIVFVNRCDQINLGLNARINGGVLQLVGANNTVLSSGVFSSLSVQTFNFPNNAQVAAIYPNSSLSTAPAATFQASAANQANYIRYINISATNGICLAFRELYAFDNTISNVALFKPTSQSNTSYGGGYLDPSGFVSYSSYGVDGLIDMDNLTSGNMVNLGCIGNTWWTVRRTWRGVGRRGGGVGMVQWCVEVALACAGRR